MCDRLYADSIMSRRRPDPNPTIDIGVADGETIGGIREYDLSWIEEYCSVIIIVIND
jgi:hypothetical protein